MTYHNPLSIFSDSQLQQIYDGNLKAVKKELMLQFQLEESVTINLNGKELDKNGVIKLLEEIERDLGLHAEIFKNKDLLRFLEDGNLKLFEDARSEEDEVDDRYYETIIDMIIRKLNNITANCANQPGFKSNKKLKSIFKFTESLQPHQQTAAYQLAYEIIDQKVIKIRSSFTTPFKQNDRYSFRQEIHKHVDNSFYNQFQYLPPHFENAKRTYGVWCNNVVVAEPLENKAKLRDFDKETLRTIARAAEIASNHHNAAGNRSIVRQINEHLSTDTNTSGLMVFFILLFAGFRIAMFISRESKTNISDYKIKVPQTSRQSPVVIEDNINFDKGYFKAFPEIIEHKNYTELIYDTPILPRQIKNNNLKIPAEIKKRHAGTTREIHLTFKDQNFSKIKLNYKTVFDFTNTYFTYDLIKYTAPKFPIEIKSYPESYNKMEVNISKYDSKSFKVLEEEKYRVKYIDNGESFVKEGKISIKTEDNYSLEEGPLDSILLAAIIKTTSKLNNQKIKSNRLANFKDIYHHLPLDAKVDRPNSITIKKLGAIKLVTDGLENIYGIDVSGPSYYGLGIVDRSTQKLSYYQAVIATKGETIDVIKVLFK